MGEAKMDKGATTIDVIAPSAGYASGEVIQLSDGRASCVVGLKAVAAGDPAALETVGQVELAKTASIVILEGAPLYWDRSANTVTPLKAVAGGDFFCGVAIADAASADATVVVDLNVKPQYTIDVFRDPTDTVFVNDAILVMGPGYAKLGVIVTSEAEKVDILSQHSIPVDDTGAVIPFIVEGRMMVFDTIDGAAGDFNIGIADDTDGDDATTDITEYLFLHFDNDLNIKAISTDGTTTVTVVDTTKDATENTYFDFAFDCRDLSDIQVYINGVLVLPDTVFALADATGPLKLLVHFEKTTGTVIGEMRVSKLAMRATDLAA